MQTLSLLCLLALSHLCVALNVTNSSRTPAAAPDNNDNDISTDFIVVMSVLGGVFVVPFTCCALLRFWADCTRSEERTYLTRGDGWC